MPEIKRRPKQIISKRADLILAKHQSQGNSNDCGPFTVTMVVNGLFNLSLLGEEVAERMNHPRWRGLLYIVRRIPNWASFPWGIADLLREYGLYATWRPLASVNSLLEGIEKSQVQLPIIGEWRPRRWAHVLSLLAYDPEKGWGFADPAASTNHMVWKEDGLFLRQWTAYGRLVIRVP